MGREEGRAAKRSGARERAPRREARSQASARRLRDIRRLNSRNVCICDRRLERRRLDYGRQRFPGVAFGGARADTRAAARGARGTVEGEGEASKAAIERGGAVRIARARGRFRSARGVRRYQARAERAERYAEGRACTTRNAGCRSGRHLAKGETVKASAARCDVAVSTAFRWRHRFLRGGAERFGGAQGDRGSGRDLRPGEPEGRARAWTQGTAAGRQGEEARPLARAGAGSHGGGPERDAARCCPGSMRRRSRLPSIRWSRRTPCWSPTAARATAACAAALGVATARGERVRGDLHVQTVNSRHSRSSCAPAAASPPAIWTTT